MKYNRHLIIAIVAAQFAVAPFVDGEGANADTGIEALKQQIQELGKKVQLLERQQETNQDTSTTTAQSAPRVTAGADGFSISSADTNFMISLHGLVQLDSRTFFQNAAPGVDGFILRRARPIISGTVDHDFNFLFMPDFGGSTPVIQDAFLNYHYTPELQLQAGKFKVPVGLEYLQSDVNLPFNERSLVSDLVPGRDLGIELHGDLFLGRVSYAAGLFNGVADGANTANSDFDNDQEFVGRLFFQPAKTSTTAAWRGLGFGVAGSYGTEHGTPAVNKYRTDGQQNFFGYNSTVSGNGVHWRVSPQGYYYHGPFGLLGEYVVSSQRLITGTTAGTIGNTAWQIAGSWFLTGEKNSYHGVSPMQPFNPAQGGWGAWELSARYARLDIGSSAFPVFANLNTSAKSTAAWSVGLSWWLNNNVRVLTSFSCTTFSGGASGAVTQKPEEVLFTRVQLAF